MKAALIAVSGRTAHPGEFNPYLEVGDITAVQRLILVFGRAGVDRVVLVTSGDLRALERHVARMGAICLHNDRPDAEMLHNLQLGLRYLGERYTQVVVTPVDVPLFGADTVRALLDQAAEVAIPLHRGHPGHPVMLRASRYADILAYEGPDGLEGALAAGAVRPCYLEVSDPGILCDVGGQGSPGELQRLVRTHELNRLRPELRISLARDKVFFGPGGLTLLELIGETGSLRAACADMGISYSKGWKMLQAIEEQLGHPVVTSRKGGEGGGSSALTPEGQALVRRYLLLVRQSRAAIEALFAELFGEGI
ncbi:MAG: NTP transferase domain-containing protein [Clostridiales bacterium]|nr:NTP transferase domain-containing protein [Clostridiales bacterium]